jgi:hypothetical protein
VVVARERVSLSVAVGRGSGQGLKVWPGPVTSLRRNPTPYLCRSVRVGAGLSISHSAVPAVRVGRWSNTDVGLWLDLPCLVRV